MCSPDASGLLFYSCSCVFFLFNKLLRAEGASCVFLAVLVFYAFGCIIPMFVLCVCFCVCVCFLIIVRCVGVSSDSCSSQIFNVLCSCHCHPLLMFCSFVLVLLNISFKMCVDTCVRSFIHCFICSSINPYTLRFIHSFQCVSFHFVLLFLLHVIQCHVVSCCLTSHCGRYIFALAERQALRWRGARNRIATISCRGCGTKSWPASKKNSPRWHAGRVPPRHWSMKGHSLSIRAMIYIYIYIYVYIL